MNKLILYSFFFFGLFPLLPARLAGLPVIVFFLAALHRAVRDRQTPNNFWKIIFWTSIYLSFAISFFYSENIQLEALKALETRLSLIVIPIGFLILSKENTQMLVKNMNMFKLIFTLSSFLLCLFYLCFLLMFEPSTNPAFGFPSGFFFKSAAIGTPFFTLEPVYFSFIIAIAIVTVISLLDEGKIKLLVSLLFCFVFISVLILLASKTALIFTFTFFAWVIFYRIKKRTNRSLIAITFILIAIIVSNVPSLKYELKEIKNITQSKKTAIDDSTDKRARITISAFELSKIVNPIFGTGLGDVQDELNIIYKNRGYMDLLEKKCDPHNQFFSTYIGGGCLGLLILCFFLYQLLKKCINRNRVFLFWTVLFFIFQMLTETILERQTPVILFSFFTSIILLYENKK